MSEEKKKKEGVDKEISQKDSTKHAEDELKNSLYFYHLITNKLQEDKVCYKCKKELEKKEHVHILKINKCDKGLVVFASICNDCFELLSEEKPTEETK